jgi:hypothetical protein
LREHALPGGPPAAPSVFPLTDLHERFDGAALHPALRWHCEPARWSAGRGRLSIAPDPSTDSWQRTHYGFEADNGHALLAPLSEDPAGSAA